MLAVMLLGATAWGRPTVVASIHPYANVIEQIVGTRMNVVQLLPSGASPHTFDPTPSQAGSIAGAALIVMNGGVDDWARRLVTAAAPGTPLFVVTDRLDYQPIQGAGGVGANPHVWLDPSLMASAVPLLVEALASVDPEDAAAFRANGADLVRSLKSLDEALSQELAPLRGAPFVPFHDAWPYFARHFGLDLVASVEPTPGREPSPRYVAEAVATIRRVHAKAVFDERQLNPRPAQVVAEAAGVPLVTLDPLGSKGESYQDLLRANVNAIVKALGN
ncbi:MAG: metal ABC transporter substrate-binding protein [Deinococcales bacterium]